MKGKFCPRDGPGSEEGPGAVGREKTGFLGGVWEVRCSKKHMGEKKKDKSRRQKTKRTPTDP